MSEARSRGSSRETASAKASRKAAAIARGPSGRGTTSRDASGFTAPKASPVPAAVEGPTAPIGFICPPCGRFVRTDLDGVLWRARSGSPPRFCTPSCRQAAYRRRQAGVAEDVALQLGGGRNRSLARTKESDHG